MSVFLPCKIDELTIVAVVDDVDFICLTETRLSQSIPDSALFLPKFIAFRNDRVVASGGLLLNVGRWKNLKIS